MRKFTHRVAIELLVLAMTVSTVIYLNVKFNSMPAARLSSFLSPSDSQWPTSYHLFREPREVKMGSTNKEWDHELDHAAAARAEEASARKRTKARAQESLRDRLARGRDLPPNESDTKKLRQLALGPAQAAAKSPKAAPVSEYVDPNPEDDSTYVDFSDFR